MVAHYDQIKLVLGDTPVSWLGSPSSSHTKDQPFPITATNVSEISKPVLAPVPVSVGNTSGTQGTSKPSCQSAPGFVTSSTGPGNEKEYRTDVVGVDNQHRRKRPVTVSAKDAQGPVAGNTHIRAPADTAHADAHTFADRKGVELGKVVGDVYYHDPYYSDMFANPRGQRR